MLSSSVIKIDDSVKGGGPNLFTLAITSYSRYKSAYFALFSLASVQKCLISGDIFAPLKEECGRFISGKSKANILLTYLFLEGGKGVTSAWSPLGNFLEGQGGKGVTSAWSPLGNFLEGQAHPNLLSNQVFFFF